MAEIDQNTDVCVNPSDNDSNERQGKWVCSEASTRQSVAQAQERTFQSESPGRILGLRGSRN